MVVEAYTGKDVTWAIGDIKVAQGDNAQIRYEKNLQIMSPLGTEEKIIRNGGRLVRWNVTGNQSKLTSWAYAIGSDNIITATLASLKSYEDNGGTLVTTVKRLFSYSEDIVWEMVDAVSKKSMTFIIKGAMVGNIVVRTTGRGFVKFDMDGLGTGIRIVHEDVSDEELNQLTQGL